MVSACDFSYRLLEGLSHAELVEVTESCLGRILHTDQLLKDVPPDATVEEVLWKIAVEHGQSITLKVFRDGIEPLHVVVPHKGSTVLTLKKSIRRHFEIVRKRQKFTYDKISWKYIWRIYTLEHCGEIMVNNNQLLSDYGVVNKSEIKFVKKKQKKWK